MGMQHLYVLYSVNTCNPAIFFSGKEEDPGSSFECSLRLIDEAHASYLPSNGIEQYVPYTTKSLLSSVGLAVLSCEDAFLIGI